MYLKWQDKTNYWRVKYKNELLEYNRTLIPTVVNATNNKCAKCNKKRKLYRHHKGHEYLFACLDEQHYALRYIKFLHEDVVKLCDECHKKVHKIYTPLIDELNYQLKELLYENLIPTYEFLESHRQMFIKKTDAWLKRKMKKRKKNKK